MSNSTFSLSIKGHEQQFPLCPHFPSKPYEPRDMKENFGKFPTDTSESSMWWLLVGSPLTNRWSTTKWSEVGRYWDASKWWSSEWFGWATSECKLDKGLVKWLCKWSGNNVVKWATGNANVVDDVFVSNRFFQFVHCHGNTSRKLCEKEPQSFSHCSYFDQHDMQSLNNYKIIIFIFQLQN